MKERIKVIINMKYSVIGEILGLLFVIGLTNFFMNSEKSELVDMMKMICVLYLPQRIALYLQCKSMVSGMKRKELKNEN